MLSVLAGLILCAISAAAICRWWPDVASFLRGFLPVGFFLAGVVAVVAGFSGRRPPKTG